jgi:hypothetical protein
MLGVPVAATDPNWLPSTLAQATAVLVAIIGGFLVSRLVSLSSERGALVHRRSELAERLKLAQEELDNVHSERLAVSKKWFREQNLNDIVNARGEVDIDAVLAEFIPRGSNEEEMRPYAEELAEQTRTAFERISQAFRGSEFPSGDLDHLKERIGDIRDEEDEIYQYVGEILAEERRPQHVRTRRLNRLMSTIVSSSDIEIPRQDARIDKEAELGADVAALSAEIKLIDEQASRFSQPEGVTSGMFVLSFFALVGVVFPMAVMATRPVPDDLVMRRLLVAAFLVGLGALLIYLIIYVKKLRLNQDSPGDT